MRKLGRRQLVKKIDEKRREYIKKRDLDWREKANCISCGAYFAKENLQIGHYYSRRHDWTTTLGQNEFNTNLQCVTCNSYKRGNIQGYATGLIQKYGDDILGTLAEAKKTPKRYKIKELEALIEKYSNPSNR